MNAEILANKIKTILLMFDKGCFETNIKLIVKKGSYDVLGISNTNDTKKEEYEIKVLFITRGSDKTAGESINKTRIGNNPDIFVEFVRVFSNADEKMLEILTGNEIQYNNDLYTIIEKIPVVLSGVTLLEQFTAKKVL